MSSRDVDNRLEIFVRDMKGKLEANTHKGDWRDSPITDLVIGLLNEIDELVESVAIGHDPEDIVKEAADVANYAMMIADVYRLRQKKCQRCNGTGKIEVRSDASDWICHVCNGENV